MEAKYDSVYLLQNSIYSKFLFPINKLDEMNVFLLYISSTPDIRAEKRGGEKKSLFSPRFE